MDSLANLTPWQQIRSPRMPRRLTQLLVGLVLYGVSMAMMVQSFLGLDPWDVLHFGLARLVPVSFGTIVIITGFAVLLAWIPLRQMPGLGTIANVVVIGLATDWGLSWIERPDELWARSALLVGGVVLNGLAGALYIGAQLGTGPRDGLMTGLSRRTGVVPAAGAHRHRGDRADGRIPARRHRGSRHRPLRAVDRPAAAAVPAVGGRDAAWRARAGRRPGRPRGERGHSVRVSATSTNISEVSPPPKMPVSGATST